MKIMMVLGYYHIVQICNLYIPKLGNSMNLTLNLNVYCKYKHNINTDSVEPNQEERLFDTKPVHF